MKISECVTEDPLPMTGPCHIDCGKLAKCFGFSIVSKYHDQYRLVNRRAHIKITLYPEEAKQLIREMNLVEVPAGIFKNASTFMTKARAEKLYGKDEEET